MSYRIQYGRKSGKKQKRNHFLGLIGVGIIFLVWLLAFGWFLPEQAQKFREVFFPWSTSEVQEAMADLRTDVRNGVSFSDAVQTFCWELMNEVGE